MKRRVLPIAVLSLVLAGCAFVKPESGSEQVQILTQQQATACKKLGYANVYTKHEVLGLKRNDESVREELNTLAKNQAASMKGDGIVITNDAAMTAGKIAFDIYRCQ